MIYPEDFKRRVMEFFGEETDGIRALLNAGKRRIGSDLQAECDVEISPDMLLRILDGRATPQLRDYWMGVATRCATARKLYAEWLCFQRDQEDPPF